MIVFWLEWFILVMWCTNASWSNQCRKKKKQHETSWHKLNGLKINRVSKKQRNAIDERINYGQLSSQNMENKPSPFSKYSLLVSYRDEFSTAEFFLKSCTPLRQICYRLVTSGRKGLNKNSWFLLRKSLLISSIGKHERWFIHLGKIVLSFSINVIRGDSSSHCFLTYDDGFSSTLTSRTEKKQELQSFGVITL